MNNKTRSASEKLNQFIDKTKLEVGTHLIGKERELGHPVPIRLHTENAEDNDILEEIFGNQNAEGEINKDVILYDQKKVNETVDGAILEAIFGLPDAEGEGYVPTNDQKTVNETQVDEENSGESNLDSEAEQETSALSISTIIGISSGVGFICLLTVVVLTILAILRNKNQTETRNRDSHHYDRGYGEEVGTGGLNFPDYPEDDGGHYQGDRNDYYPVI